MTHLYAIPSRQAGLSLIELMIALTIGLLVLVGLTLIFVNSSEANRELQKTAQQIENGRYAIDTLTQDLHHAGFYGHFHELPAAAGLPDPCEVNDLAVLKAALAYPVQGYRAADLSTAADISATTCDDALITAANLKAGSDVLVVRRAHTLALTAGIDSTVNGEVYIQATGIQAEIQLATATAVLAAGNNAEGNPTLLKTHTGATAPIRKLHTHVYFVAPCSAGSGANGVCQGGDDAIPTLKRLELGSVGGVRAMRIVPLVEGIEYFKIEYGVDSSPTAVSPATELSGDSTVDSFTTTPADWTQAVAAKVYLLARNTLPTSGHVDDKNYLLGSAPAVAGTNQVVTPNDKYRRHAYSATVRIVNAAGRREIP